MQIKTWHVEIFIYEDDDTTSARAVLHSSAPGHPEGIGRTRRSPDDVAVPEIGDEVATARALHHLADTLLGVASEDIEAIEHRSVHLSHDDPPLSSRSPRYATAGPRC
jgi:hypothetical protein